jgi:sporulation protein YlmC with PRC-barrel domain
MNATDIKGKAVISVTNGARLGRVDDVLFDAGSLAIAAFRVSAEGQQALIPFAQVQSLGSDAVMVPGDDVAQWITTSSAGEGLISFDALKGYKVLDDAGTLLGTPQALEIEPTDGRLRQLQVHKGGVLGMGGQSITVPGSAIASVGADVIVVRAATPSA